MASLKLHTNVLNFPPNVHALFGPLGTWYRAQQQLEGSRKLHCDLLLDEKRTQREPADSVSNLKATSAGAHIEMRSVSTYLQHFSVRIHVGRTLRYLVTSRRDYSQKNQKVIDSTSEEAIFLSGWDHNVYHSARITEKKSVFVGHASCLHSASSLNTFLEALTAHPSLKRATHCMYAYRLIDEDKPPRLAVGQHDGGEKGSGDRLSKLLEMSGCKNVVVVVSRWYGGVKLGSDRWKMISNVAKESLQKGKFYNHKATQTHVQPKKARNEKNK